MTKYIIDRRLNPKGKSLGNRQRFLKRVRKKIRENIKKRLIERSITDEAGESINIPVGDINEPSFGHNHNTGEHDFVLPGNEDLVVGDLIPKPKGCSGKKGKDGSPDGESEDDFEFHISKEEYFDIVFEDLELPRLKRKNQTDTTTFEKQRAGYMTDGNPAQLDVIKSVTGSLGRRIALGRNKHKERLKVVEEMLNDLYDDRYRDGNKLEMIHQLETERDKLKRKMLGIPFIDKIDLRYRAFKKVPKPKTSAVMICVMDVSASMGEQEKELAKRFYLLLYRFLQRKYKNVDVVFIRHHTTAKEVNEDEFFNSKESGGTVVSTGLQMASDIINERYDLNEWNVYIAQASDGDNWPDDMANTKDVIESQLINKINYFFYIELMNTLYGSDAVWGGLYGIMPSGMWDMYLDLAKKYDNINCGKADKKEDILPLFRKFFKKEEAKNG